MVFGMEPPVESMEACLLRGRNVPSDQAQRDSGTLRRHGFRLLKTVVCKHRGFESHSLRPPARTPLFPLLRGLSALPIAPGSEWSSSNPGDARIRGEMRRREEMDSATAQASKGAAIKS